MYAAGLCSLTWLWVIVAWGAKLRLLTNALLFLSYSLSRCSCLLPASPQRSCMELELLKVFRSWGERCILSHTPITEAAAWGCGPQYIQWELFSKVVFVTERWNAHNNKGALKTTSADKDRQDYWKRLASYLGKGSLCFQIPLWKISWPDCGLSGTGELITDSTPPRGCSAACGILRKKIIEKKNQGRKGWIGQAIGRAQIHLHLPRAPWGVTEELQALSSGENSIFYGTLPSSLGARIHKVKEAA